MLNGTLVINFSGGTPLIVYILQYIGSYNEMGFNPKHVLDISNTVKLFINNIV